MAQIDHLIAKLVQCKAKGARLRADSSIEVSIRSRQIQWTVVSEAQLRSTLLEILPDAKRADLDRHGAFNFSYQSPYGVFDIAVNAAGEKLEVAIRPASTSSPAGFAPQTQSASPQVYCPRCGGANQAGAIFCTACGQALKAPASSPPNGGVIPRPVAPSQIAATNSTEVLRDKAAQFLTLPLFRLPWGCITIPVVAIVALELGMVFAPLLLALVAAKYVWNSNDMTKEKRQLSVVAILLVGLMLNGLLIAVVGK